MENIISDLVNENSKLSSVDVNPNQFESEKRDLKFGQVPYRLMGDVPLAWSFKVDRVEYVFPKHVVIEVTLILDIKTNSRENINGLLYDTFYSLFLDLFHGLDEYRIKHTYPTKFFS